MTKQARKEYKGILYTEDEELNLGIFNLSENNVITDFDFVLKVSIFVELVGFKKFKNIVFQKRDQDFEISVYLYKFTQKLIIKTLFDCSVESIYFLVTDERYQKYQSLPENIYTFKSIEEVIQHIQSAS